jgi:hypothetical protein
VSKSLNEEELTMRGSRSNDPPKRRSNNGKVADSILLEFCEACFITFGSREQRVFKDGKVLHPHCARRARLS